MKVKKQFYIYLENFKCTKMNAKKNAQMHKKNAQKRILNEQK